MDITHLWLAGKSLGGKEIERVTVGFHLIDQQVGFSTSFSVRYTEHKHHPCFISETASDIILPSSASSGRFLLNLHHLTMYTLASHFQWRRRPEHTVGLVRVLAS